MCSLGLAGALPLQFALSLHLPPAPVHAFTGSGTAGTGATTAAKIQAKDVYLQVNELPTIGHVRIGNFYEPFSIEDVSGDQGGQVVLEWTASYLDADPAF